MHQRDKDEIRYYIDGYLSACIRKDWAAVGNGCDRDWRGFSVTSECILDGVSALIAEVQSMLADSDLIAYEMVEIDYLFHGDMCLAPHIVRMHGATGTGSPFEVKLRTLDIFENRAGQWQRIAGSTSLHRDSLADPELVALLMRRTQSP